MEFKQLESFIAVLDMQSFSKAAEKLFVTQPTVSTQIATLERELDTQLLIRSSKDVQPTREGRIFYRYAKEILDKRHQALLSFQNLKNPVGGVISIAASSIPIRHYLPPLIAAFQRQALSEMLEQASISPTMPTEALASSLESWLQGERPITDMFLSGFQSLPEQPRDTAPLSAPTPLYGIHTGAVSSAGCRGRKPDPVFLWGGGPPGVHEPRHAGDPQHGDAGLYPDGGG